MPRVWISYEPFIYAEVWAWLFESLESVEVVKHPFAGVDVIVFPLDDSGQPQMSFLPEPLPEAKFLAVSPTGTCGLVRLPGEDKWHAVQPFGLSHLLLEVQAGRELSDNIPQTANLPSPAMPAVYPESTAVVQAGQPGVPPPQTRRILLRQRQPYWAAMFAAPIVALFVVASVMAASSYSLPGELLYPVKRWAEKAQLLLTSDAQWPMLQAEFAERRLEEIEALARQGVILPDILEEMAATTQGALDRVKYLRSEADRQVLLKRLVELTHRQQTVLSTIPQTQLSDEVQAALEYARQVSILGHREALMALSVSFAAPTSTSGMEITITIETPVPTLSDTPSAVAAATSTPVANPASTETVVPSPSSIIFFTQPPTLAPSQTPTWTATPISPHTQTADSIVTSSPTPKQNATQRATFTPTRTRTATWTDTPTATPSHTPTWTATPTPTRTRTASLTNTATPSRTPTRTATPTPTRTRTASLTNTPLPTPSHTPTQTATPTPIPSATATETASSTPTPSDTPLPTETETPTPMPSATPTATATETASSTPSGTPIPAATEISTVPPIHTVVP